MTKLSPIYSRSDVNRGILFMLGFTLLTTAISSVAKALSAYSPTHIIFFRSIFALLFILLWARMRKPRTSFKSARPFAHVLRGVLNVASLSLYFWALGSLPLAEVIALSFSQPLLVAALSGPMLAERVGWRRWLVIATGFAATLVILRPEVSSGNLVERAAVLVSAFLWALSMVLTRRLSLTESSSTIVVYFLATGAAITGLTLPIGWQTPTPGVWLSLVVLGALSAASQFAATEAYRWAPAAVVSPYYYATLLWAGAVGYVWWSEVPDLSVGVGAAILITSGIYLAAYEARNDQNGP